MFDLDAHIRSWRQSQSASLGDRPDALDVLDELDAHLRDDFERMVRSGESPDRAWSAAVARIGAPERLAGEFAKLTGGRAAWLPARIAAVAFIALAAATCGVIAWRFLAGSTAGVLLASHTLSVVVGYGATLVVGALAAWSVLSRAAGAWDESRAAAFSWAALRLSAAGLALTLVAIVLGASWAHGHLGRYWAWDAREVGGLCVLAWNGVIYWAVRRRRRKPIDAADGTAIGVGVAGNIVVSLAWALPPFVMRAATAQPPPRYGPYLLAFVGVQVLLLIALASVRTGRSSRAS
jgi:hypothetical protein